MLRILAHDSDLVALSALRTFAKTLDFELAVALSPAETVETIAAEYFDALLLVAGKQDETRELCRRLRAFSKNRNVRLLLASDGAMPDPAAWGADDAVEKPIMPGQLRRALAAIEEPSAAPAPAPASAPAAKPAEEWRRALSKSCIVLVDDDEGTMGALKKQVSVIFPGAEIETAFDPATGLSIAARHRPGLIILDHMMPGMDGKEFLKALRSHPVGKSIPVLAYSALSLGPVYENEANVEFLKKPATVGGIEAAIAKLWERVGHRAA